MAVYLVASVRLVLRSDLHRQACMPAVIVLAAFGLIWVGDLYDYAFNFQLGTTTDKLQMTGMAVAVVLLTASALLRARILPSRAPRRPSADAAQAPELLAELQRVMATDKPYLDPQLTLASLADSLATTTHELSRAINQHHGENYSRYINRHRIGVAKELLRDSSLPIAAVLARAGFKSSSTFNAAFLRVEGVSPRQYRRRLEPDCRIDNSGKR